LGIPWGATGEMSGSSTSVLIILLSYVPSVIRYQDEGAVPSEDVATKVYWLVVWSPLKNIWVRQLGWLFRYSQYMESHNPFMFQTTEENIPWCDVFCAHCCWYRSTELMLKSWGFGLMAMTMLINVDLHKLGENPWDTWYNPSKFMIQILLFYNPPFFLGGIIGISWGYIEYRMINTVEQWSRTPYVSRIFISSLRSRNSRPNSLGSSSRYSMPGASHGARAWRPRLRWGVFLWLVNACY
jgi:hypothetical protein